MAPSAPPPQVLAYADLPARHGIQYDIRPDGATFVIPQPPWWRRAEIVVLIALLPFMGGIGLYKGVTRGSVSRIAGSVLVMGILVAATVQTALRRRAAVIEVTPTTVRLENTGPVVGTAPEQAAGTHHLPRELVYDVRYVEHSGHVIIRIRGHELIEFNPVRDRRANAWIAKELRRALGLPA